MSFERDGCVVADLKEAERLSAACLAAMRKEDGRAPDCTDVLVALEALYVVFMGTACPHCRRNIAEGLRRRIPRMLMQAHRQAERFATK
jgi:hypothetical protein